MVTPRLHVYRVPMELLLAMLPLLAAYVKLGRLITTQIRRRSALLVQLGRMPRQVSLNVLNVWLVEMITTVIQLRRAPCVSVARIALPGP